MSDDTNDLVAKFLAEGGTVTKVEKGMKREKLIPKRVRDSARLQEIRKMAESFRKKDDE